MGIAALAAAVIVSQAPAKYAMPGLNCVNFDDKSCTFFGEQLAELLQQGGGVEITTQAEIAAVLGMERQKQMLGCGETDVSCLAELAGALGTDGLVLGNLARVGSDVVVSAKIVHSRDAKTIASANRRVKSEAELLDALGSLVTELRTEAGLQRSVPTPSAPGAGAALEAPAPSPLSGAKWATAGVGVAAAAGGGILMGMAHGVRSELHATQSRTGPELQALVSQGRFYQDLGMPLLIGGAVVLAAGGGLFLLDAQHPPSASLQVSASGFAVTFGGTLP